jgi:hypothetical protein
MLDGAARVVLNVDFSSDGRVYEAKLYNDVTVND